MGFLIKSVFFNSMSVPAQLVFLLDLIIKNLWILFVFLLVSGKSFKNYHFERKLIFLNKGYVYDNIKYI